MRTAGLVVGGVIVSAGVAVWLTRSSSEVEIEQLRAERDNVAAERDDARAEAGRLATELAAEKRHAQRSETELGKVQMALQEAQHELAVATAPPPPTEDAPSPDDWHTAVKAFPAYAPEGLGDALGTVDWEVVATSMSHMPPLIAELATHLKEGRPMTELSAGTVGSIQQYNGPLVTTAMRLSQQGVAGTDVNGAFSHPGFMSNALAATLLALEMPLTKEQSAKLAQITSDYAAREAKRVAGYGEDAYKLEQILDESTLKHAYFQEVYALLTPQQLEAVRPEAVAGRTQLDIFCESLVWSGKAGPMVYDDRPDLAKKVANWALARGRLPESTHDAARALIAQWVDEIPEGDLGWEADGLVNTGMLHVENVASSGAHVLALLKTFDRELDLDAGQRQSLRQVPGTITFYRKPAP